MTLPGSCIIMYIIKGPAKIRNPHISVLYIFLDFPLHTWVCDVIISP